jgi:hypothetical protein
VINMIFFCVMTIRASGDSVFSVAGGVIAIGGIIAHDIWSIDTKSVSLTVSRHIIVAARTPSLFSRGEYIAIVNTDFPVVLGSL